MLISPTKSKHVVYITLSSYVASFVRYVYHVNEEGVIYLPEDFPFTSPRLRMLHDALYKSFVEGLTDYDIFTSRMQPNKSYCELGYQYAQGKFKNDLFFTDKPQSNFLPEKPEALQAFALPDVYYNSTWRKTTEATCLTPKSSSQFRSIAKLMFWLALSWHIDNIYNPDLFPTLGKSIEDFLLRYNIDIADLETISRSYRRERTSCTRIANNLFDAIDPVRPIFFLNKS